MNKKMNKISIEWSYATYEQMPCSYVILFIIMLLNETETRAWDK